jgi:nicotinate-nucleotide pyrophosphorylase (carboxylating)
VQDLKPGLKIEVEARSLENIREIIKTGKANRVMLDNFSPEKLREALGIIQGRLETEASGGINLENIREYAATGVDFISTGALIHQAKSLDLSLKAV